MVMVTAVEVKSCMVYLYFSPLQKPSHSPPYQFLHQKYWNEVWISLSGLYSWSRNRTDLARAQESFAFKRNFLQRQCHDIPSSSYFYTISYVSCSFHSREIIAKAQESMHFIPFCLVNKHLLIFSPPVLLLSVEIKKKKEKLIIRLIRSKGEKCVG